MNSNFNRKIVLEKLFSFSSSRCINKLNVKLNMIIINFDLVGSFAKLSELPINSNDFSINSLSNRALTKLA